MNQRNPVPARRRHLKLLPGSGSREDGRLDQFLVTADPLLVASLRREERQARARRLRWSLATLLVLATAITLVWTSRAWLGSGSAGSRLALDTEKARLLLAEGRRLLAEDDYREALARFTEASQLAPGLPEAWLALGDCQMRNYQSAAAERAFRRALRLAPGSAPALERLGNLHLRRGEEAQAEALWQRGRADRQLARLYLLQGRFDEAAARLQPLLRAASPDDLLVRMAKAARSRHLGSALRSLLEPEPTGLSSWAELGWRLVREKHYAAAAAAFRRAVAEIPRDVNALSGLGWSLLADHRVAEAKTYFERALRLDRDHVVSLNGLAHSLKGEGRTAEAIAVWQGMSELYPGVNYGTPGLAWTYYELRDYRHAAVQLARLAQRYPYDARLLEALAVAVENLGAMSAQ